MPADRGEPLEHFAVLPVTRNFAGNIRKQLSQVVCIMGSHDFPGSWPELIDVLAGHLSGADLDKLMATLSTMDELFRHYRHEMKSNKLWSELAYVLQHVSEVFLLLPIEIKENTNSSLSFRFTFAVFHPGK